MSLRPDLLRSKFAPARTHADHKNQVRVSRLKRAGFKTAHKVTPTANWKVCSSGFSNSAQHNSQFEIVPARLPFPSSIPSFILGCFDDVRRGCRFIVSILGSDLSICAGVAGVRAKSRLLNLAVEGSAG
jgi:hypothetical protein